GSRARVLAPHLDGALHRDEQGKVCVRDCLRSLLAIAESSVRRDEAHYLPLVAQIVETGSLSERVRSRLEPFAEQPQRLRAETRVVYGELADCLVTNTPWKGRGFHDPPAADIL